MGCTASVIAAVPDTTKPQLSARAVNAAANGTARCPAAAQQNRVIKGAVLRILPPCYASAAAARRDRSCAPSVPSARRSAASSRSYAASAFVTGPSNGDEVLCFNGATAAQVRRVRESFTRFPCEGASGHRASRDGSNGSTADFLAGRGGAASRSCERSSEEPPDTESGSEVAAEEPQRRRVPCSLSMASRLARGVRSISEGRHRDPAASAGVTNAQPPPRWS
jgi:hypothetical protein